MIYKPGTASESGAATVPLCLCSVRNNFFSVTFNDPSGLLYHKARVNESIQNCKSAPIQ